MVALVILVITGIVALSALICDIEEIMTGEAIFGMTWFEITFILLMSAYWTVIARIVKLYGNYP
jgi:hypothetical protein